jgi:uncharacterized protein (DUF736 family)
MKIGTFTKSEETGEFKGRVQTLTLGLDVRIFPIPMKSTAKAPDFRVVATTTNAEIGAGWKEIAQDTGNPYVSIKLDDPSFASPIWAALTQSEKGEISLFWTRPSAQKTALAA